MYILSRRIPKVLDLTRIFFDWHILLVAGCLLVILPVIFIVSSLDKRPVKIKRIHLNKQKTTPGDKSVKTDSRERGRDVPSAPRNN